VWGGRKGGLGGAGGQFGLEAQKMHMTDRNLFLQPPGCSMLIKKNGYLLLKYQLR